MSLKRHEIILTSVAVANLNSFRGPHDIVFFPLRWCGAKADGGLAVCGREQLVQSLSQHIHHKRMWWLALPVECFLCLVKRRGKKTQTNTEKNECDIAQFLTRTEGINWMCMFGGGNKFGESKKKEKRKEAKTSGSKSDVHLQQGAVVVQIRDALEQSSPDANVVESHAHPAPGQGMPHVVRVAQEQHACNTADSCLSHVQNAARLPACLPAQPTSSN